jgi:hypothetical protein
MPEPDRACSLHKAPEAIGAAMPSQADVLQHKLNEGLQAAVWLIFAIQIPYNS